MQIPFQDKSPKPKGEFSLGIHSFLSLYKRVHGTEQTVTETFNNSPFFKDDSFLAKLKNSDFPLELLILKPV